MPLPVSSLEKLAEAEPVLCLLELRNDHVMVWASEEIAHPLLGLQLGGSVGSRKPAGVGRPMAHLNIGDGSACWFARPSILIRIALEIDLDPDLLPDFIGLPRGVTKVYRTAPNSGTGDV